MKADEFFHSMKTGNILSCYLFEGEEEYLKESALQQLRQKVLLPPFGDMNETVLNDPDAETLITVSETLPMMADKRLVVIRDSSLLSASREGAKTGKKKDTDGDSVSAYIAKLPPTTCLVFFTRGKANGVRKLYKEINKLGGLVSFEQLSNDGLVKWIARELKAQGKQIAQHTAEQLIFTAGRDLGTLKNELGKAAAHAGERDVVEREDIAAVVTPTVEYKVFDLADNVAEGNAPKAISLMNNLIREGEQRFMLLALLQRQYRQLLFASILTHKGVQSAAIAQQLSIPPFVAKKMQGMTKRFSIKQLKDCYDYCVDMEFFVKSGQMAEEGALEQVVYYLLKQRK